MGEWLIFKAPGNEWNDFSDIKGGDVPVIMMHGMQHRIFTNQDLFLISRPVKKHLERQEPGSEIWWTPEDLLSSERPFVNAHVACNRDPGGGLQVRCALFLGSLGSEFQNFLASFD